MSAVITQRQVYDSINPKKKPSAIFQIVGSSEEDKPVGSIDGWLISSGSTYFEADSGMKYVYLADTKLWYISEASNDNEPVSPVTNVNNVIVVGGNAVSRVDIEDAPEIEITATSWGVEYVIPGTSTNSIILNLPAAPAGISSLIKVTLLATHMHADEDDETLLVPPAITIHPQQGDNVILRGFLPQRENDRFVLTVDTNFTAIGMVCPNPIEEQSQGGD